jgi:hypothetical protein
MYPLITASCASQMVFTMTSLSPCHDGIILVVSLPTHPQHVSAGMGGEKGTMMLCACKWCIVSGYKIIITHILQIFGVI